MVPARALKYSSPVLVKALGSAPADGRALSAFDKVRVVTEHTEPESQVGVGDLVQGVSGDAPDGDSATYVAGPP